MSNVRITVSIDPKLKEQLDTYAAQKGLDRSAAFEQILKQHFEQPRQEPRPQPQNPAPLPPTPQPQPYPPSPPPQIGVPEELEKRIQELERYSQMTRQYLNLVYPMTKEMLVRNAAYYTYIYGTYLEVAVYPPPPWWEQHKI